MSTAALFRILDTRRRIAAIQEARRLVVIRRQIATMRATSAPVSLAPGSYILVVQGPAANNPTIRLATATTSA